MGKKLQFNKRFLNKKGLSGIVITVIMIVLGMGAIVFVGGFVNNMIKGQIKNSESCFGNYDKVTLNEPYTCWDRTTSSFKFGIILGDIEVEKVIVALSIEGDVKSYTITNTPGAVSGLSGIGLVLPTANGGKPYTATGITSLPDSIQIAPVISGTQCEMSDSIAELEEC